MLNGNCPAQTFIAADYATNSTYASWSEGQNGGYGFGPWSFNGTDANPDGQYQGMSSSSPLGMSWTLMTHDNASGLANAGRAITAGGGLQIGQTLSTVIENPSETAGIHTYRGFDLLFTGGPDNNGPGVNAAALRAQVFDYFNFDLHWTINDASGHTATPITGPATAAAGVAIDFTLTSTNTYSFTMTPLNGSTGYSQTGTYEGPINWVNFRLWNTASGGLNDTANNFEISSMTIAGLSLNIQKAGTNVILSWPGIFTNFTLVSSTDIGPTASWNPVQPDPVIVDGQNVVTNPISGAQQFYRLRLLQ